MRDSGQCTWCTARMTKMNTILHGENQTALRNHLNEVRNSFESEVLTVDGKTISPEGLIQSLQLNSLFADEKKLVIVENLSANKALIERLPQQIGTADVILVEEKETSKTQISALEKIFGKLNVQDFKIDPVVFKFLDSLSPNASKKTFLLWQEYKKSDAPEVVLIMLARQFRLLLLSKFPDAQVSPDWARLSDWQRQKLIAQGRQFETERLKEIFSRLSEIDYQSKTGQLALPLADSIELVLLTL